VSTLAARGTRGAPGVRGARAGRESPLTGSGALVKLAARRDRVMLPAWIYVITILVVSTGYSFKGLYKTLASREALAAGISHDPTTLALAGPLWGTSVGSLTAYKVGASAAVAAGLMSIFIVIRHTRADEEAGRLELIGSTAVGRSAALAVGVLLAAVANGVVVLLIFAGLVIVGLPAGGSAALALAIGTCGLLFAAVAAVAAQLSESARGARGIAIGVLAAAYLLMSAGAAAGTGGLGWLMWLSPIGWANQVRAYAGDRWLVLALPLAATVLAAAAAAWLAGRRDLGAGLVPPRPGPAQAARSLRSPLALAWRLQRVSLIGWAAGVLVAGAVFGSIANNIGSLLGSGAQVKDAIARLGGQSGLTDAYLAAMMGIMGLVAAGYAVSVVLHLRSEETSQRAEPVLASAAGRLSWGSSYLVVAAAGSAVVLAAAGLGAGLSFGLRAGATGTQLPRLLGAALAQWPAVLVVAAVAMLLFGLWPESCVAGGWTALGVAAAVVLLGPTLRLAQPIQDISPFTHVPRLSGGPVNAAPLAWLTLAAVLLAAAGMAGLRRRDIG
jgi:ABC-2 type transport system permease protein